MEVSEVLDVVNAMHREARSRGLYFQTAEDEELRDRRVVLGGQELLAFTSCSYLALEHHPALVAGVHDAVDRYGTQFSSSRGYVSAPPYRELEASLGQIFDGHALVVSSTTLGHQVALPALVTEKDAIVLDHQVHYSVQMAANLARANGARVEIVRHNELDRAAAVVERLARTARTVWFATDGVFSMYGDLAPLNLLRELLAIAPNVRLYVDDAHGMSWAGRHGRGSFLSRMPMHERMVLATSLNKAFSASGGCLVFPTAAERDRVLLAGGPMAFSGPLQPPMLGAALASAKVHLSDEIVGLQGELAARTKLVNDRMKANGLPLLVENEAPIFFVRLGLPRLSYAVAEKMKAEGVYVNVSMFPSVPMKRSGIRFSVTVGHSFDELTRAVDLLGRIVPEVLAEEKVSRDEIDAIFAGAVPEESLVSAGRRGAAPLRVLRPDASPETPVVLSVDVRTSIHEVDRDEWNHMFGGVGSCSWDAQRLAEEVFRAQDRPEYNWDFRYVIVRDGAGHPVAATFFSTCLSKDDMLMRDEVSKAVELRRKDDPYFLTSLVVGMGSGFSEGNHLYLDRSAAWQPALTRLLRVLEDEYDRRDAGMLLLRDLPGDDPVMDAFLMDHGLVKVPMFDSHYLDVKWTDMDGFLAQLTRRGRSHMRGIMANAKNYTRKVYGASTGEAARLSPAEADWLYTLYRNVADRKQKLNVFPLPRNLVDALQDSPVWEIVAFHLDPDVGGPLDGRPVAWYAAHRFDGHYAPFLCGLDYRYVYTHGAYRNMLFWMVQRLQELGIRTMHLGMDADTEKSRLGTRLQRNAVYVQVRDHYNSGLLRDIVAEVGVDGLRRSVPA